MVPSFPGSLSSFPRGEGQNQRFRMVRPHDGVGDEAETAQPLPPESFGHTQGEASAECTQHFGVSFAPGSGTSRPRRRSIVAPNTDRWDWARELPSDEVGFATYNVMAVFSTLPIAEEAAAALQATGLAENQISVRTRTMT